MELVPWRPFQKVSPFHTEMDRMWSNFLNDAPFVKTFAEEWMPSVDVSETKDNLVVKAELPGIDAKNINMSGNLLTIKGEKEKEEEEKDEHHYFSERYCGSFQRTFQLPTNVQHDKLKRRSTKVS